MKNKRDSIVVYRSFYEAAKALGDQEELELYRAIFEFGLDHKNTEMGPMAAAMFKLIQPQLEANYKKWQNGMRGGRPKQSESEEEPNDNQKETKNEPNVNVNDNVNANANVFIRLQLNDKSFFPIYDHDLVKYRELYPAVNVEQELRNMVGWIDGSPTKRKTKTGILKFVNSWLSKEQDQGGRKTPPGRKAGRNLLKEVAR
jgi:hypothetical protein